MELYFGENLDIFHKNLIIYVLNEAHTKEMEKSLKKVFAYPEFFIAITQCCHLVVSVPSDQFAQRADQLVVSDTVHVHLLLLVLQALEPPEVGVRHGLDEPVTRERLLVWVSRPEAFLTVRHLTCHTGFDGILRRVLLAELALDWFRRRTWAGHGGADGD